MVCGVLSQRGGERAFNKRKIFSSKVSSRRELLGCRAVPVMWQGGAGARLGDDKVVAFGPVLEGRVLGDPVSFLSLL